MRTPSSIVRASALLLATLVAIGCGAEARADKRTVCTITVNSPDEKEMFRQRLPGSDYQFVELVERGRPDWLASACRQGIRCDLLVISGHFDSGTEFYSDRLNVRESLPVAEMERASCSDSCPGVFSQLKEVYLFGCNTLNADPVVSTSRDVERSLIRSGLSPAEAERAARVLDERHAESNRDQMRRIFIDVPVIYGFSSLAPLGPTAATFLSRYFESGPTAAPGSGRADPKLLNQFAGMSMAVAGGLRDSDPQASHRREVCQFVDDRLPAEGKLDFIHSLLSRDIVEFRMFLDRIEGVLAAMPDSERRSPSLSQALKSIANDQAARDRYLRFAENSDQPQVRARMIRLAGALGWLSPEEQRVQLVRMVGDLITRKSIGSSEVELICSLDEANGLARERHRLNPSPLQANKVNNAAALACLGSAEGRARTLRALTSPDDDEVEIAQVYLRHRPITDVDEIRALAGGITRMHGGGAQVRALETLGRHHLSDGQSLNELARLFPNARSVDVQRAIAAVFIRADAEAIPKADLVRILSQSRLKSSDGDDIIDILIRRLRAS